MRTGSQDTHTLTGAELIQYVEAMYESEPLSSEYMGEHCLDMRRCLKEFITPLDVELPNEYCVSQVLWLMKKSQLDYGFIDNALIRLFIHRAIKRSIEASKAQTVNYFSNVLAHITMHMDIGEKDWQGKHPRIDDFDEYISLVEEAERALVESEQ